MLWLLVGPGRDFAAHIYDALLADTPKKSAMYANDLNRLDRQLVRAETDSDAELRKGLRQVLSGSDLTLLPADIAAGKARGPPPYGQYGDARTQANYNGGYARGRNDEDDEMLDADPAEYDDLAYGAGGTEWAEQEYDERYPDGYPDEYYGEYEGEELGEGPPEVPGVCNSKI